MDNMLTEKSKPKSKSTELTDSKMSASNRGVAIDGDVINSVVVSGDNNIIEYVKNIFNPESVDTVRPKMLDKTKRIWIDGVFTESLYRGKELRPAITVLNDVVQGDPMADSIILPATAEPPQTITDIDEYFFSLDGLHRTLLITGEPGSGKTTIMLKLARTAIQYASSDINNPIPVILNLASWPQKRLPLRRWLISELKELYSVPTRVATPWVEKDTLLLFLDGLDEVASNSREACIQEINHFVDDNEMGVVVCCRKNEYMNAETKLKFLAAVEIHSLTAEQIQEHLDELGAETLHGLIAQNENIQEMAQSPLMLHTMLQVYGQEDTDLIQSVDSIEDFQTHLFDKYIEKRLSPVGARKGRYENLETRQWLSWLADGMLRRNQSTFLIEKLQPAWLPSKRLRWLYFLISRLSISLIGGIVGGLVLGIGFSAFFNKSLAEGLLRGIVEGGLACAIAGFVIAAIDICRMEFLDKYWKDEWELGVVHLILVTLLISGTVGLAVWLGMGGLLGSLEFMGMSWQFWFEREGKYIGLLVGMCYGLLFGFGTRGVQHIEQNDILSIEELRWSPKEAFIGAGYGVIGGVAAHFVMSVLRNNYGSFVPLTRLFPGNSFLVVAILVLVIFGMMLGGFRSWVKIDTDDPNQGITQAKKNMLAIGGGMGIVFCICGIILGAFLYGFEQWQQVATIGVYSAFFGVLSILWYGALDVAKHGWLRLLLTRLKFIPKDYADFLNYASERVLLRKIGGGYIFYHRLLMEHIAGLDNQSGVDVTS